MQMSLMMSGRYNSRHSAYLDTGDEGEKGVMYDAKISILGSSLCDVPNQHEEQGELFL